ncbi:hypothetical protein [Deinococcus aquaedulcis]|uniref:hypothetical protein n=1 Tax=Deinococcus aquaedulcis TaxID=2840455 RepID=UPI001C82EF70|nr:hypothetical protein [Deinococcus aquaedulcis]
MARKEDAKEAHDMQLAVLYESQTAVLHRFWSTGEVELWIEGQKTVRLTVEALALHNVEQREKLWSLVEIHCPASLVRKKKRAFKNLPQRDAAKLSIVDQEIPAPRPVRQIDLYDVDGGSRPLNREPMIYLKKPWRDGQLKVQGLVASGMVLMVDGQRVDVEVVLGLYPQKAKGLRRMISNFRQEQGLGGFNLPLPPRGELPQQGLPTDFLPAALADVDGDLGLQPFRERGREDAVGVSGQPPKKRASDTGQQKPHVSRATEATEGTPEVESFLGSPPFKERKRSADSSLAKPAQRKAEKSASQPTRTAQVNRAEPRRDIKKPKGASNELIRLVDVRVGRYHVQGVSKDASLWLINGRQGTLTELARDLPHYFSDIVTSSKAVIGRKNFEHIRLLYANLFRAAEKAQKSRLQPVREERILQFTRPLNNRARFVR